MLLGILIGLFFVVAVIGTLNLIEEDRKRTQLLRVRSSYVAKEWDIYKRSEAMIEKQQQELLKDHLEEKAIYIIRDYGRKEVVNGNLPNNVIPLRRKNDVRQGKGRQ